MKMKKKDDSEKAINKTKQYYNEGDEIFRFKFILVLVLGGSSGNCGNSHRTRNVQFLFLL